MQPLHGHLSKTKIKMRPSIKFLLPFSHLLLVLFSLQLAPVNSYGAETSIEYKVKAAFLLNFAKFITWPKTEGIQETDTFKMCLLGDNLFGSALLALEKKSVGGKNVEISNIFNIREANQCKMIFVSRSEINQVESILTSITSQGLVTVSDIENFAQKGGMIEFVQVNQRISFKVNLGVINHQDIEIKASLLNVAHTVLNQGRK